MGVISDQSHFLSICLQKPECKIVETDEDDKRHDKQKILVLGPKCNSALFSKINGRFKKLKALISLKGRVSVTPSTSSYNDLC